jgi:hypothetical protein
MEPTPSFFLNPVSAVYVFEDIGLEPIVNNEYVLFESHNLKFNHKVHKTVSIFNYIFCGLWHSLLWTVFR